MLQVNIFSCKNNLKRIEKVNNIRFNSVPNFNNRLLADKVTFTGTTKPIDKKVVKKQINNSFIKNKLNERFGEPIVNLIAEKVNSTNIKFLDDILDLSTNNFKHSTYISDEDLFSYSNGVIELLNYVSDKNTNVEEFSEKLDNFKNLKQIVKGFGFKKSILAEHIDDIPMKGIVDILKSDMLLNNVKYDYNSFQNIYNYSTKFFEHHLHRVEAKRKKQGVSGLDKASINDEVKTFMKNTFSNLLLLKMIFDEKTCNELMFNRAKYIDTIYIPRLKMLDSKYLQFLRKFQLNGITYKDDKDGDLKKYGISLDDKIHILNLMAANKQIINSGHKGVNMADYIIYEQKDDMDGNFKMNFQNLKMDLMDRSLRHIGVEGSIVDKYMKNYHEAYNIDSSMKDFRDRFFDINYAHLLPLQAKKGTLLRDIIVNSINGPQAYRKFLFEGDGPVATVNAKNREAFEKAGIDFDKWIEPMVIPVKKQFSNIQNANIKTFKVEAWKRNAQESLFDGNYTTCCTGIDKEQGESFPIYLTNAATTTLEVRTEDKNKVVAMSRLLLAKIKGKTSLVIENIEVNNKIAKHYLDNDKAKQEFRDMIFDYAQKFAQYINNNNEKMPVYFCGYYYKIKDIQKGLKPVKSYDDIELIGEFPDGIWLNSYGRRYDRNKVAFADDGDGLEFKLHDITK